jgi:hypothetical protein
MEIGDWRLDVVCESTLPRTYRIKFDAAGLSFARDVILDVCGGCLDTDAELIAVSINSGLGVAGHALFQGGVACDLDWPAALVKAIMHPTTTQKRSRQR